MTSADIVRMAREAGLTFDPRWGMCTTGNVQIERLVRAAYEAGAAAEREACAKVAEKMLRFYTQAVTGVPEAIRARGQK